MIDVFIVDDEPKARETLSNALTTFFDHVKVVGTAGGVEEAFHGINYTRPQLVFLDVEMGPESGFQLLEKFQNVSFQVAFVTAHEEFALKAIKFSALDYIIKPPSVSDLKALLNKVEASANGSAGDMRVENMFGNFLSRDKSEHKITIPTPAGYEFVPVQQIMYLRGKEGYSTIHLHDGKEIMSSKNLKHFEGILDSYGFFRIHNSTIINLKYVKSYRKKARGLIIMEDDVEFSVALARKAEFLNLLEMK